jgi:UDP-GlcNAc:undecaprenyl-phosphate/decaprenyl-phosphate GlcNAc-1-phosphate transferase
MTTYFLLIAFSITIYFIIYYKRQNIGKLFNVIDVPNEKRKIHKTPTPKTASYSIVLLLLTFIITDYFFNFFLDNDFNIVLVGTLAVFFVGYFDDKYKLSAIVKIILISLIGFVICILSEKLIIERFYLLHLDFFFLLKNFSIIFTVLCILCLTNALNLADGINGLAVGIVLFWLLYLSQIYDNNLDQIIFIIIFINLLLIFIHNYKGYHFLGDAGSLMFSSFIAFLTIYLHNINDGHPNHQTSAESITIIFLIPVIDMLRLFFERLINKKSPYLGDNNHLHHYLIKKFNHKSALVIYFMSLNIPIIFSLYTSINKLLIILVVILIYLAFIIKYKINYK